jgi:hypothetical protein
MTDFSSLATRGKLRDAAKRKLFQSHRVSPVRLMVDYAVVACAFFPGVSSALVFVAKTA